MEPDKKSNGALLGSVVIIIILVIGGIYIFKKSAVNPAYIEINNDTNQILTPEDTSSSTEIEAELNSIDLESLDSEL